jgi:hypothetical protein
MVDLNGKRFNLMVRKDCGIRLPFEWVSSHLRERHDITVTSDQATAFLGLEGDTMTVGQTEDWIKSVCVRRAVLKTPTISGYKCTECVCPCRSE